VSARDWIAGGLLFGGVAVQLLACVGLLAARTTYDRLHLVAPAAMLGGPLACAGVLVNESFSQAGIHAILVAAVLLVTAPVLTHVTARAARLRETDGLVVLPSELPDAERG
jgi:monovalent cation/proton antiporter MnhG/PhaG subunit